LNKYNFEEILIEEDGGKLKKTTASPRKEPTLSDEDFLRIKTIVPT